MRVKIIKLNNSNYHYFNKIKIPQSFIDSPPKPEKLIHKMLVFSRECELDDIFVDENFYLLDGYCSYLIAEQVGPEFVKIKMVKGCCNEN